MSIANTSSALRSGTERRVTSTSESTALLEHNTFLARKTSSVYDDDVDAFGRS